LKLLGFELGLVFGVRIRLSKTKSALRLGSSVSVKAMVRSGCIGYRVIVVRSRIGLRVRLGLG